MTLADKNCLEFMDDRHISDGNYWAIASIDARQDFESMFEVVKNGYIAWRERHGDGIHKISIYATVSKHSEANLALVIRFRDRWNVDEELLNLPPVRAEFDLEYCDEDCEDDGDGPNFGCATGTDIFNLALNQSKMKLVDHNQQMKEIDAIQEAMQEAERERRRIYPVHDPVKLPRNIASEIARYLRLEYGESYWQKDSVKARDLKFEGEFVVNGVPTQYWRYQTSSSPQWATVERFKDTYCIGMTVEPPPTSGKF